MVCAIYASLTIRMLKLLPVGDILDRMSGGRYISAKHRVLSPAPGIARLSVPFFFDPGWYAPIAPFDVTRQSPYETLSDEQISRARERWENNTTFTKLDGVWAQYLAKKVQKVFPNLALPDFDGNKAASTRFSIAVLTPSQNPNASG